MNLGPKVSICIPVYNASAHIDQAMATVLYQDYPNREIVVVDDASKDDSWDRLQKYAGAPGVRLYRNPDNLGIGGNWNRCVELAEGEYIKFVHCDDLCYTDCVSTLVAAAMAHPEAGLVFSARDFLLHDLLPGEANVANLRFLLGVHARQKELAPGLNTGSKVLNTLFPGLENVVGEPTNTLIRKSALGRIGGFDVRFRQLIDIDGWIRLLLDSDAVFVPRFLSQWRVHEGQTSQVNAAEGRVIPELCLLFMKHADRLKGILDSASHSRFAWTTLMLLLVRKKACLNGMTGEEYACTRSAAWRAQGGAGGMLAGTVRYLLRSR